jgi:DNA-binding response OmpR family regulator
MSTLDPKAWINLERVRLLLLDDHPEGAGILTQIISAIGIRNFFRTSTVAEAQHFANAHEIHLIIVNANLKHSNAFAFIEWLRRANIQPTSFAPVILVTGHTQRSNVERARDCGANSVIAKPVSPMSVLERIVWVAKEKRPYVQSAAYVGPDRRFHNDGPPAGVAGRRYNDTPDEASEAAVSPAGFGASIAKKAASQ